MNRPFRFPDSIIHCSSTRGNNTPRQCAQIPGYHQRPSTLKPGLQQSENLPGEPESATSGAGIMVGCMAKLGEWRITPISMSSEIIREAFIFGPYEHQAAVLSSADHGGIIIMTYGEVWVSNGG